MGNWQTRRAGSYEVNHEPQQSPEKLSGVDERKEEAVASSSRAGRIKSRKLRLFGKKNSGKRHTSEGKGATTSLVNSKQPLKENNTVSNGPTNHLQPMPTTTTVTDSNSVHLLDARKIFSDLSEKYQLLEDTSTTPLITVTSSIEDNSPSPKPPPPPNKTEQQDKSDLEVTNNNNPTTDGQQQLVERPSDLPISFMKRSPAFDQGVSNLLTKTDEEIEALISKRHAFPIVNDDYLFPDSITPTKIDHTISQDYDIPYIDDDYFIFDDWYICDDKRWCYLRYNNVPQLADQEDLLLSEPPSIKASPRKMSNGRRNQIRLFHLCCGGRQRS